MTKKLKILGPYTPEHPGPFCTRDGKPARVLCNGMKNENSIVTIVEMDEEHETVIVFREGGRFSQYDPSHDLDLMNAEEVPVAREFWLVGCNVYETQESAEDYIAAIHRITLSRLEIIHVREVLPEEPLAQAPSP